MQAIISITISLFLVGMPCLWGTYWKGINDPEDFIYLCITLVVYTWIAFYMLERLREEREEI